MTVSPFRKKRKPRVGARVYTKSVEIASGAWSSCVESAVGLPVVVLPPS